MTEESPQRGIDVKEFISNNKERYDTFSSLQERLNNITQETIADTIKFVQDNSNIFFKDRSNAIFFVFTIRSFALVNFKKLELVLDVCANFATELKNVDVSEFDIIRIFVLFFSAINYLFSKNMISIQTIIHEANYFKELFINFLPEIEQYDPELARSRERLFTSFNPNRKLLEFYNFVKEYPKRHIFYRKVNYNQSFLHKSIRNDDLSSFQSLLEENAYSVNEKIEYSYYERTITADRNPSLIQTAALYGSLNIFKFLWEQNDIIIDENLLAYAYSGRNHDIIQLCETKCSDGGALLYAIQTRQQDLVDIFIENKANQIEEIPEVKEQLANFVDPDDANNKYKILNYNLLKGAVAISNFPLFLPNLKKIVYIIENIEDNSKELNSKKSSFFDSCFFDIELFKFFYSHKSSKFIFCGDDYHNYSEAVFYGANDAVRFLIEHESPEDLLKLFRIFIRRSNVMANMILDLQLKRKEEGKEEYFNYFKQNIRAEDVVTLVTYYDEDLFVKMVESFGLMNTVDDQSEIVGTFPYFLSRKMIQSLIPRITPILSFAQLTCLATLFFKLGYSDFGEMVLKSRPEDETYKKLKEMTSPDH
ncbi:hypothetical protein M9Y10_045460 [Tritrichomonas musculus]|uniref:DUF3447 domain-containing protein n=1 Tax=Tritrichomonas musculus TaxID=1915356 RepID=A0ABR2JVH2_9EUKA